MNIINTKSNKGVATFGMRNFITECDDSTVTARRKYGHFLKGYFQGWTAYPAL